MATSYYYPNSTGSTAYKGNAGAVPPASSGDLEDTTYDATQKGYTSTDDSNGVDTGRYGPGVYPGHEMTIDIVESDLNSIDITVKASSDESGATINLYAYNFDTSAFVELDSVVVDGGPTPNIMTLSGSDLDPDDYVSGGEFRWAIENEEDVYSSTHIYSQVSVDWTPSSRTFTVI